MENKLKLIKIFCILILLYIGVNIPIYSQTNNIEDRLMFGINAMQNGVYEQAISCFEDVLKEIDKTDRDVYCTILLYLGTCYQVIEKSPKAIELYEQAIAISKEDSALLISIYPILLSIYNDTGDVEKANLTAQKMETFIKEQKIGNFVWDYASSLLLHYQSTSNYIKGVEIGKFVASINTNTSECSENELLRINISKNSFFLGLAQCYESLQQYQDALRCWYQSLNYICDDNKRSYPLVYCRIGDIYNRFEDYKNALTYYHKSLENWDSHLNPADNLDLKAKILCSIGEIYIKNSNPLKAIHYLEEAKNIYIEINSTEYLPYMYAHLYQSYLAIGDTDKVNVNAELLLETINGVHNWEDEVFLICYSVYGDILSNQGKYNDAIYAYNKVLEKRTLLYDDNDIRLFWSYYDLAHLYLDINELDNALFTANRALDIAISANQINELLKAKLILIHIERKKGNIGKAISDYEILNEQIKQLSDSSALKSSYYSTLAGLYGELGASKKMLEIEKELLVETKKHYTENSPNYAITLLNLSESYAACKKQAEAIEYNIKALSILKNIYGERSTQYHKALQKLGSHYYDNLDKAIKIYTDCMNLSKDLYGERSEQYADDLIHLYQFRISKNIHNISTDDLNHYITGINIKREIGATNNFYYLSDLSLLSTYYLILKDYDNRYLIEIEYYQKVKEYLKKNFQNLTDWQRKGLWAHFQSAISSIPTGAIETSMPVYNRLTYNCALLSKALLLTSSNSLAELIYNSNNEQLVSLHKDILKLKAELTKIKEPSLYNQKEQLLGELERKELESIISLGSFNDFIDIDWTDVQNSLNPNEVAIEFISYPTKDCISYAAIVIGNNFQHPIIIPLFNDKEFEIDYLKSNNTSYDYSNPEMYRIVWDILAQYALNGIETIYFAPDGILHKMPIENFVDKNGITASQKWNLYRVSSTREIVTKNKKNDTQNVILYGGLKYDLKQEQLIAESRKGDYHPKNATRSADLLHLRYGVKYLPGTKTEVENIYNRFQSIPNAKCYIVTDVAGTEESFKSLASKDINIIHLATHGFYWSEEDAEKRNYVSFLSNIKNKKQNYEDMALLRSGLFFSGANIGLAGESLPDDVEDGVLTAKELSAMNLGNVDMVVMSACQSGLGETSGEGVFGLQRGFKLAGANTLLMSLWKVDDDATLKLMTSFYDNYLNGMSKRESLLAAQKKVRDTPGWEDPYYWAGFILLDGLN